MMNKYDIFISYRRDGGYETAKHLFDLLRMEGYSVSFDIDTLGNGVFNKELYRRIDECKDFIVILSRGALDRCIEDSTPLEVDWMRNELAYAIQQGKNIIPILGSDFVFPENLPQDIAKIQFYNGVVYNRSYFDAMYNKLKTFLQSKPHKLYPDKKRMIVGGGICLVVMASILVALIMKDKNADTNENEYIDSTPAGSGVIIKASLLDSSFITTDSYISQIIKSDDYFGRDTFALPGVEFYSTFHYVSEFRRDTCVISPWGEYVGDYYASRHITMVDPIFNILGEDLYVNEHYPILDVKLVNNSGETIVIDNIVLDVEESVVDKYPFVVLSESGGFITFTNQGWNGWGNCKFRFSLHKKKNEKTRGKYTFEVDIPTLVANSDVYELDMFDYLVKSGVDYAKLEESSLVYHYEDNKIRGWGGSVYILDENQSLALDSLKAMIAPVELEIESDYISEDVEDPSQKSRWVTFKDPGLWLDGVLEFDDGRYSLKVNGNVRFLTSEGYGAPGLEISRKFDVKFRENDKDYIINFPVSLLLKNGEGDRIVLQLNADKTSRHRFKVRLDNINGHNYNSNPVDLLMFKYNLSY